MLTFTSIVGVILSLRHSGSIAPAYVVGPTMGAGGLLGGVGASLREDSRQRGLGRLALALGVRLPRARHMC